MFEKGEEGRQGEGVPAVVPVMGNEVCAESSRDGAWSRNDWPHRGILCRMWGCCMEGTRGGSLVSEEQ